MIGSQGFRSAEGALSTIAEYEAMNIIRKGQIWSLPQSDVVGQKQLIERLFEHWLVVRVERLLRHHGGFH